MGETADINAPAQPVPAVVLSQAFDDVFQGFAVQWVVGLWVGHDQRESLSLVVPRRLLLAQKEGPGMIPGPE